MGNSSLHGAKRAKNDEFYTQISDIEKELRHYKDHFRNKTVFCNCDDPDASHFWKYFSLNFEVLGLRRLITTHFDPKHPTYMQELVRGQDGKPQFSRRDLEQNGDFRSPECIGLLQASDIVVTNPPFSLFREYVAQLVEHEKQFLIIGNSNAITYKEIFPLLKDNLMWLGFNNVRWFGTPDGELFEAARSFWYTNLDHAKRHEELILYRTYKGNEDKYPKYVNYDAIEVSNVKDMPADYEGAMGVPITFMDKMNPDQFEIIGNSKWVGIPMSQFAEKGTYPPGGMRFYLKNRDGSYKRLYDRIVIRRRT